MGDITNTLSARNSLYGDFLTQAQLSCSLKEVMQTGRNWPLSPDKREALDMIAVKISRILNGDPDCYDSWHDIEGYARLVSERLKR